jgi:hypothetical protein
LEQDPKDLDRSDQYSGLKTSPKFLTSFLIFDTTNLHSKTLSQLVDGTSIAAMKLLKLDTDFLINTNPYRYWAESEKFTDMKRTIDNLKVVIDVTEERSHWQPVTTKV